MSNHFPNVVWEGVEGMVWLVVNQGPKTESNVGHSHPYNGRVVSVDVWTTVTKGVLYVSLPDIGSGTVITVGDGYSG